MMMSVRRCSRSATAALVRTSVTDQAPRALAANSISFSSSSSSAAGNAAYLPSHRIRNLERNPYKPSDSRKAKAKLLKKIDDICGESNVGDIDRTFFNFVDRKLSKGVKKSGGRNNHGRLTAFRKGGGFKRRLRTIDFKRSTPGKAEILTLNTHDPMRTAPIALARWIGNEFLHLSAQEQYFYMLAPEGLRVGDVVENRDAREGGATEDDDGMGGEMSVGTCAPLSEFPIGANVHNVEIMKGKGGQLCRAAGTSARLLGHTTRKGKPRAFLQLPSGSQVTVPLGCRASLGILPPCPKINAKLEDYGSAGRMRRLGRRPVVRGVAMNPCDHPHGGGEGKTSGGRPSVSPWGRLAKGGKTRKADRRLGYRAMEIIRDNQKMRRVKKITTPKRRKKKKEPKKKK